MNTQLAFDRPKRQRAHTHLKSSRERERERESRETQYFNVRKSYKSIMLRRSTTRIFKQTYIRRQIARFCDSATSSSSSDSSSSSSRLHSTDIAFKPAESGWGSSKSYASKWDDIFGKSKKETKTDSKEDNKWHEKVLSIEREIQALPQDVRETLLRKLA